MASSVKVAFEYVKVAAGWIENKQLIIYEYISPMLIFYILEYLQL